LITIRYKSLYRSKEESKGAAKLLLKKLNSSIKSGSMVANDKKNIAAKTFYLTTLDINLNDEIVDYTKANEFLQVLSNNWKWRFASIHTNELNIFVDNTNIQIPFIKVMLDNQENVLGCRFFVEGDSEKDVLIKLEVIIKKASINYYLGDVSKYFKIDDCYIIDVMIPFKGNAIKELKNILVNFSNKWIFTGLEAYTEECALDEHITEVSASFREAVL